MHVSIHFIDTNIVTNVFMVFEYTQVIISFNYLVLSEFQKYSTIHLQNGIMLSNGQWLTKFEWTRLMRCTFRNMDITEKIESLLLKICIGCVLRCRLANSVLLQFCRMDWIHVFYPERQQVLNKVLNRIKNNNNVEKPVHKQDKTFLFRWEPCLETGWRTG